MYWLVKMQEGFEKRRRVQGDEIVRRVNVQVFSESLWNVLAVLSIPVLYKAILCLETMSLHILLGILDEEAVPP